MSIKEMQYTQWPIGIDLPTMEEYEEAERKYQAVEIDPRDFSDWCVGLQYVMATSDISCWKKFFAKLDSVVLPELELDWYAP